jgi:patatin-related protein
MREKELRLALVCFGGISLAIYMHGISKEILKLVRASAALHAIPDRARRAGASFFDSADPSDPEYCTEPVYFELLREIGQRIELRVIVDIIAGASAGGINGTMLARALAHDLPMGRLRDLWLEKADVTELLAREARAKAWSKWFLKPLIWGFSRMRPFEAVKDIEVRHKLSLFVRSRWFKAPLDGLRMAEFMYDAVASMGEAKQPNASLVPAGQKLDLFVTLTDFYGYHQLIQIHDPPLIREREHRHILHFGYSRWPSGEVEATDFDLQNAPALAFAARATSSFPGAFPPAQIAEIDRLLKRRGVAWTQRDAFLKSNFEPYAKAGLDPIATSFVDGSVLNNKPFREAIQALKGRPAYRQVDRRLVYIDPDPTQPPPPASGHVPGFFTSLKGALSDIPRNEPIADELSWVNGFNERVRRLKSIVEAARPHIARLVADIAAPVHDRPFTVEEIRGWREAVNDRVAQDAGFAYEGYVRLKLGSVRALGSHLIATLCRAAPRSLIERAITEIVDTWAAASGITYGAAGSPALRHETTATDAGLPPWVQFLLAFDIDYRKRRLHFLIQGQNRLYQILEGDPEESAAARTVDRMKRDFYHCLEALHRRESEAAFSAGTKALARSLFAEPPSATEARHIRDYARTFVERNATRISTLVGRLAAEIDLDATTHDVDALLAAMDPKDWNAAARHEVLVNYLGFPFWDVLTLSVTNWRDAGEFDEILIDRISPEDARTLNGAAVHGGLKGIGFGHFGAFLSRAYRENDYLFGRLQAADRLIDIVCDSAGIDPAHDRIDVIGLKRRAFERILDVEERHLSHSGELIALLRGEIAKLNRSA